MPYPSEIQAWLEAELPDRNLERAAVKTVLAQLSKIAPGKSVELRVPPYAAVQVVEGPAHRRGTPSAVVEMSSRVLIQLAIGETTWDEAQSAGAFIASGERSDLSALFPIWNNG